MHFRTISLFSIIPIISFSALSLATWNPSANNNVALYWGQNAISAINKQSTAQQKGLLHFCQNTNVDIIVIGFVYTWGPSVGVYPLVDFSNACTGFQTFIGTKLLWCPTISQDITNCQKVYGKKILISLGGGSANYQGFSSTTDANTFAQAIWAMFGNQWSYYRPFGEAIVDGFDLDLEHGPAAGYDRVAVQLRQLMDADKAKTGKQWLLTAAPQCMEPDAMLDTAMRSASFDAIFVQFYNNPSCQASKWVLGRSQTSNSGFNFAMWDSYAKKSKNPKMKVFMALPLANVASGYVTSAQAANIIGDIKKYTNFGGIAGWDASIADQNTGYITTVKNALNSKASNSTKRGLEYFVHSHHKRFFDRKRH